jgi:hypothetical protein
LLIKNWTSCIQNRNKWKLYVEEEEKKKKEEEEEEEEEEEKSAFCWLIIYFCI